MSKGLHPSSIDYIAQAERIGRMGRVLNICTGCKPQPPHNCPWCYARNQVLHGWLKGHKSYPYGFEPTFHPERIRAIGGRPKLIFLNDMGDVGGGWKWRVFGHSHCGDPDQIANMMAVFARQNPDHILLLLTKNPAWYRFAEWPDNVWCGFSASTNEELLNRASQMPALQSPNWWMSLEPWLDDDAPIVDSTSAWLVIGGLSGKNARDVSDATYAWLVDESVSATRFTKANAYRLGGLEGFDYPRDYPESWRVPEVSK